MSRKEIVRLKSNTIRTAEELNSVKTPIRYLSVRRVVFSSIMMPVFKPSARTVRNFARAPPPRAHRVAVSAIMSRDVKFKPFLAALFTPRWHRVHQSSLRSVRWRHAFVQSESGKSISASASVHLCLTAV